MSGPLSATRQAADTLQFFRKLFLGIAHHRYPAPAQFVDHFADRQSGDGGSHADADLLPIEQRDGDLKPNLPGIEARTHGHGHEYGLAVPSHEGDFSTLRLGQQSVRVLKKLLNR